MHLTQIQKVYVRFFYVNTSGCSSVGRMLGLGPRGRRFESCHPDLYGGSSILIFENYRK